MPPRGMRRRTFLTGVGAILASPLVSGAQPPNKSLTRIGWLVGGAVAPVAYADHYVGHFMRERPVLVVTSDLASRRGLEAALRDLGYRATIVALDEAVAALTQRDYVACLLDRRDFFPSSKRTSPGCGACPGMPTAGQGLDLLATCFSWLTKRQE